MAVDKIIKKILSEDRARDSRMFAEFNPYTGQGSIGARLPVEIPDFPIPRQWLPVQVARSPLVKALVEAGGIDAFLISEGITPDEEAREQVFDKFVRLRSLHDFPFWAASFVYIKNKGGGDDVLFRLTYPQRLFVERLEEFRVSGVPIRIVMLKARQWGGSTTSQIYMAWLQLVHRVGLNSLIVSQVQDASIKIKEMFRRAINAYPLEMLYDDDTPPPSPAEQKLVRVGGSDNTQQVPQRNCTISVGTAEKPDSVRSGDYSLVHCSEVGLWKATDSRRPEDIVRSACSGVLYRPYTMIVYESTANGVGNFFHREYVAAKNPDVKSQFSAFFVPWFHIELYRLPFDSLKERMEFAAKLYNQRNNETSSSDREEPGKYLWWLWQIGAPLEGIKWYVEERAKFGSHGSMASEYPSDDVEAFVNSGSAVFDKYLVERLRATCCKPNYVGEVFANVDVGEDALIDIRFRQDSQGLLSIWSMPEVPAPDDKEFISDRYLTVVDIGGRSPKADWSVIVVFDRLNMIDGGLPAVVAQWYGHIDIDLLAWKAAQIAAFYDNSLLVIESNTIETHEKFRDVDGSQFLALLTQIKDVYPNLYARRQSEEAIREGLPARYGFHTNVATKPMIISTLVKAIREQAYVERDARCVDEYLDYEKKQNGSYGARDGCHDDLLMTRAIGLHICFFEMQVPQVITRDTQSFRYSPKLISEASF